MRCTCCLFMLTLWSAAAGCNNRMPMCIGSFSLHSKWIGLSKQDPNSLVLRRDVESDRLIGNSINSIHFCSQTPTPQHHRTEQAWRTYIQKYKLKIYSLFALHFLFNLKFIKYITSKIFEFKKKKSLHFLFYIYIHDSAYAVTFLIC